MFAYTDLLYFSSIIFKKNHGFVKKSNLSEKNVLDKEGLASIDIMTLMALET